MNAQIPEGFVEVTKEEFYKAMGPLNVHPYSRSPYFTSWEMVDTRRLVGWSYPGWKNGGMEEKKVYALPRGAK